MDSAGGQILLATSNPGKLREIRAVLEQGTHRIEFVSLADLSTVPPEPAETGATFAANARLKAIYYSTRTGLRTLADDSGLEVDALGGEPGVRSARFAGVAGRPRAEIDAANNRKLIERVRGIPADRRTARFRCVLALADGERIVAETEGTIEGRIIDEPRGGGGFGYDPHFFVESLGCTTAELSAADKNRVSHRGQALRKMAEVIVSLMR